MTGTRRLNILDCAMRDTKCPRIGAPVRNRGVATMTAGPRDTLPAVPDLSSPQRGSGAPTPLSLLEQIRARETGAWARLFALYQPLVRSWCQRAGLRGADVEDVIQEVFAAA